MRAFIALLAAVTLAAPALAQRGWHGGLDRSFSGPVAITSITIGEELAEDDDDIGEREFARLIDDLRDEVASQLADIGRFSAEPVAGAARLELVITDAKPNRPTQNQLGRRPGLSIRSFSIGGAEIEGVLYDASGVEIGAFRYAYFSDDIRDARARSTWSDARRSFDRFARRLARELNTQAS
ncbi:MAG: hypothetical protein AAFX09_11300 [Pseudomonadota bacterium]